MNGCPFAPTEPRCRECRGTSCGEREVATVTPLERLKDDAVTVVWSSETPQAA